MTGRDIDDGDPPGIAPRYDQLAQALRDENLPTLEQLTARIPEPA
jgi:hypothetical protein